MPIEIREVLIRAVVDPQASESGGGAESSSGNNAQGNSADTVAEAVKKVFELLRDKEER